MMYEEFIERTKFDESYITIDDYTEFIEQVYMNCKDDKNKFCKKLYKLHVERVSKAIELMIASKTLEEKEKFINNEIKFDDIEKAQKMLKVGFFKKLKELYR